MKVADQSKKLIQRILNCSVKSVVRLLELLHCLYVNTVYHTHSGLTAYFRLTFKPLKYNFDILFFHSYQLIVLKTALN